MTNAVLMTLFSSESEFHEPFSALIGRFDATIGRLLRKKSADCPFNYSSLISNFAAITSTFHRQSYYTTLLFSGIGFFHMTIIFDDGNKNNPLATIVQMDIALMFYQSIFEIKTINPLSSTKSTFVDDFFYN